MECIPSYRIVWIKFTKRRIQSTSNGNKNWLNSNIYISTGLTDFVYYLIKFLKKYSAPTHETSRELLMRQKRREVFVPVIWIPFYGAKGKRIGDKTGRVNIFWAPDTHNYRVNETGEVEEFTQNKTRFVQCKHTGIWVFNNSGGRETT